MTRRYQKEFIDVLRAADGWLTSHQIAEILKLNIQVVQRKLHYLHTNNYIIKRKAEGHARILEYTAKPQGEVILQNALDIAVDAKLVDAPTKKEEPVLTGNQKADIAMHSVGNLIAENAELRFENARLKKALSKISAEALASMVQGEHDE